MFAVKPILIQDSYVLKGYRDSVRNIFLAECELCHQVSQDETSGRAVLQHYLHMSREHGYVISSDTSEVKVADPQIQRLIQDAQEFGLPLPGYDDHDKCAKFYKTGIDGNCFIACLVHRGNEFVETYWLGYL